MTRLEMVWKERKQYIFTIRGCWGLARFENGIML